MRSIQRMKIRPGAGLVGVIIIHSRDAGAHFRNEISKCVSPRFSASIDKGGFSWYNVSV